MTRDVGLYALTALIWGTTWIAVTFQTGRVAPEVSVFYRFALAAVLFLAYAVLRRSRLAFSAVDHAWLSAQGVLLCLTFVSIYVATTYITSGIVAIVFSLVAALNILGMRIFFGLPTPSLPLVGAAMGIAGVALIFAPKIALTESYSQSLFGLLIASLATLAAALSTMVVVRNQRNGIPAVPLNFFGLLYAAASAAIYALATNKRFEFDWSPSYVASLLFLSIVGSVLVFAAYFELIRRIGAERSGYVSVAVPVIALLISGIFEDLHFDALAAAGYASCVIGNVLVLRASAPAKNAGTAGVV